jgi:hypothetical protein
MDRSAAKSADVGDHTEPLAWRLGSSKSQTLCAALAATTTSASIDDA